MELAPEFIELEGNALKSEPTGSSSVDRLTSVLQRERERKVFFLIDKMNGKGSREGGWKL